MRRDVSIYLLVAGLVFGSLGFLAGAAFQGDEFKADMTSRLCNETVREMPDRVPQRLLMDITDEWNRTLSGEALLVVESGLDDALAAFTFSDRIFPRFEGTDPTEAVDENHTMRLVFVLGRSLELMRLDGMHCSNHVFVAYTSNQPSLTLRIVHELGHFFGLSHEWGDATYMGYLWCWGTHAERFSEEQLEILDIWNRPGSTEYMAHWERDRPGLCPWELALYLVVPLVPAGVLVYLIITRRHSKKES